MEDCSTPNRCFKCGREIKDGESSSIFIDPKTEWWLSLMMNDCYCTECANERRKTPSEKGMKDKKVGKVSSKGKRATP